MSATRTKHTSVAGTCCRSVPFGLAAGVTALVLLVQGASASPLVTPIRSYDHTTDNDYATVAARGGVTAITMPTGTDSRALLVGVGGAAPTAAIGVGMLPLWAHPQVGTDAAGHTVVTYPRCTTTDVSTCDLYAYDVTGHVEAAIPGVNLAGTAELDGAMDRGAVAFNRWTPASATSTPAWDARTRLFYKSASGKARRLTTKGGRQLSLRASSIVQLRDTRKSGDIGNATISLELVTLKGQLTTVRRSFAGESGQTPSGASIFNGQVVWASCWNDRAAQLWRYDISRRQLTKVLMPARLYAFASTSANGGVGTRWIGTNALVQTELLKIDDIGPGTKTRG